jgi:hypothetical protein
MRQANQLIAWAVEKDFLGIVSNTISLSRMYFVQDQWVMPTDIRTIHRFMGSIFKYTTYHLQKLRLKLTKLSYIIGNKYSILPNVMGILALQQ